MEPELKKTLKEMEDTMNKTIERFEQDLTKIRAGKASPVVLDGVRVDYYGTPTPLNQVGTVSTADARTLTIQPFERKMIPAIERAIVEANLGFNPQNDGILIRVVMPVMTEERRKQLVKQAKEAAEDGKVAIRNIRRDANENLKKAKKNGVAEDAIKAAETEVQKTTDGFITKIDKIFAAKEAEIMHV